MSLLSPDVPDISLWQSRIRFWLRLEPRSRTDDLTRGLQAQVRDPLWFLARQWQVGEFIAEDNGSPIKSILRSTQSKLTRFHCKGMNDDTYLSLENQEPLETIVEKEIVYISGDRPDWKLRIQLGYQFETIIYSKVVDTVQSDKIITLLKQLEIAGIDPKVVDDVSMDDDSRSFLTAILGPDMNQNQSRVLDGEKLLDLSEIQVELNELVTSGELTSHELDHITNSSTDLNTWHNRIFSQPSNQESKPWQTNRLEYEFSVSAPNENGSQSVLISREYDGVELDWFDFSMHHDANFKIAPTSPRTVSETEVIVTDNPPRESIPTVLSFYGCPNHRWWRFEDAKTDFGALELNKVDLGKLLMMDFALIQSNDWFVIPYDFEIGSLCKIDSLEVTNVFGETSEIHPAGKGDTANAWNRWDLFSVSIESPNNINQANPCSNLSTADLLFIPPAISIRDESSPLETVRFLRDEMANMVWGIETKVRNHLGSPLSGYDAYNGYLLRARANDHSAAVVAIQAMATQLEQATLNEIRDRILVLAQNAGLVDVVASINRGDSLEDILAVVDGSPPDNESVAEEIIKIAQSSPLSEILRSAITANVDLTRVSRTFTPDGIISLVQDAVIRLRRLIPPSNCTVQFSDTVEQVRNTVETQADVLGIPPEKSQGPPLNYRLASVIPENWIPYVACRIEAGERDTQYRQGSMIRNDPTLEPEFVPPKTRILKTSDIINEETVSRAGTEVRLVYQRTRWINGQTYLWLSRNVSPGRGEGASGLKFDFLE